MLLLLLLLKHYNIIIKKNKRIHRLYIRGGGGVNYTKGGIRFPRIFYSGGLKYWGDRIYVYRDTGICLSAHQVSPEL